MESPWVGRGSISLSARLESLNWPGLISSLLHPDWPFPIDFPLLPSCIIPLSPSIIQRWRLSRHASSKCWLPPTSRHDAWTRKKIIIIAVKSWNLSYYFVLEPLWTAQKHSLRISCLLLPKLYNASFSTYKHLAAFKHCSYTSPGLSSILNLTLSHLPPVGS